MDNKEDIENIKNLIASLDYCVSKNLPYFQDFINFYSQYCQDWCISSDYCIDDDEKKNSTIAFSIFPYSEINYLSSEIKKVLPKDIKNTNENHIKENIIKYLKDFPYFFNFVFTIKDDYKTNYKEIYKQVVDNIEKFAITDVERRKYVKRIAKYNKNKFPKKLFANIHIISILTSYLVSLLLRNCPNVEKVLWVSDRGNETSAFEGVIFDMYNLSLSTLKSIYNTPKLKINGIAKENPKTGKFEFDEIIKVPDYFAGIIAAFDFKKNTIDEKFKDLLVKSVADNNRLVLISLENINSKLKCYSLNISKK